MFNDHTHMIKYEVRTDALVLGLFSFTTTVFGINLADAGSTFLNPTSYDGSWKHSSDITYFLLRRNSLSLSSCFAPRQMFDTGGMSKFRPPPPPTNVADPLKTGWGFISTPLKAGGRFAISGIDYYSKGGSRGMGSVTNPALTTVEAALASLTRKSSVF